MRFFLLFAIVIAAMTFAVQNAPVVTINLFFWTFDASLSYIVVGCFAAGGLVTLLASFPQLYELHRMRSHERQLMAQLADLEARESNHIEPAALDGKQTGEGFGRSHVPAAH